MTKLAERIQKAHTKTLEVIELANRMYGVDLQNVSITFDVKRRAFGLAGIRKGQWVIAFNPFYMEDDAGWKHIFHNTIPHEVAHLVCMANPKFGKNHNPGWKRVCASLGGNSQRVASVQVEVEPPARKLRKYAYVATCGTPITLSAARHSKIQRGMTYRLRGTGGQLNRECAYKQVA